MWVMSNQAFERQQRGLLRLPPLVERAAYLKRVDRYHQSLANGSEISTQSMAFERSRWHLRRLRRRAKKLAPAWWDAHYHICETYLAEGTSRRDIGQYRAGMQQLKHAKKIWNNLRTLYPDFSNPSNKSRFRALNQEIWEKLDTGWRHGRWVRLHGLSEADLVWHLKRLGPEITTELNLSGRNMTDNCMAFIKPLKRLHTLRLIRGTRLTDNGLLHLAGLASLRKLNLTDCYQISDKGVAHLVGLKQLRWLSLENTLVSEGGLRKLKALGKLEYLRLDGCSRVTRKGLSQLKGHPRLKRISLENCGKISDLDLQLLRRLMPGVKFIR